MIVNPAKGLSDSISTIFVTIPMGSIIPLRGMSGIGRVSTVSRRGILMLGDSIPSLKVEGKSGG